MRSLLTVLLLFSITLAFSQDFGDFDKSLLEKEKSTIDSSANAELLQHYCKARYEFTNKRVALRLEYFQRIKIYDDQAVGMADFEIPVFVGKYPVEEVSFIKAVSYNLENGEVVETKLAKKQIYEEDINEKYLVHKFAVPNVKKGTIIEVSWHIFSPYIYTIPTFYFQHSIPVSESLFDITVPGYMSFTSIPKGHIKIETSSREVRPSDHHEKTFTFKAVNVPIVKEDDYVLNIDDYRSSVKYEILSTQFPGNNLNMYSESWEQIGKNLMNERDFGYQLTRKLKELDPIVDHTEGMTNEEKIRYCYEYVQSGFAWNGNYSRMTTNGLKKLLEDKSGSIADLNILLINLLRRCDIEAYPLLTKLRYSGILNTNFPSLTNLNYLVACLPQDDGSHLFLDASTKGMNLGQLPLRAVNIAGVMVKKKEVKIIPIANPNKLQSRTLINYEYDIENNKLLGAGTKRFSEYAAYKFRSSFKDEYEDRDAQNIDQDSDKSDQESTESFTITDMQGMDDIDSDVDIKYSEINADAVQRIEDEIIINSTFGYGLKKNPFTDESRAYPIFYNYRVDKSYVFILTIPEGYEVSELPENLNIKLEGGNISLMHTASVSMDKIIVKLSFKVKEPIVLPEEYGSFKLFYEKYLACSKEKIILKKI